MRRSLIVTSILLLSVVLLACAKEPAVPQQPGTPTGKPGAGTAAKPDWEQDWERTLTEAKKEGRVTVYTGYGAPWRTALGEAMQSQFGVTVEPLSGRSEEMAERIMREQRNKAYQADVAVLGSPTFTQIFQNQGVLQPLDRAFILPEVADPKLWWDNRIPYFDPGEKTGLSFYLYVKASVTFNANIVKPDELRSWKDLLNPRWKGKILLDDPTIGGGGQTAMMMLAYGIMDWDFVRALAKQEPAISRDGRLIVEWVAREKYPLAIDGASEVLYNWIKEGVPLKQIIPSEGGYMISGIGNVFLPQGAPHPNAAKVFLNFLLSKEGQTLSSIATGHHSARVDVPTDHLDPINVRQPGMKLVSAVDQEFLRKADEYVKGVVEIFRPLVK
ncbi:MAG: extracellular solute-binding protein [Chloroflexi bacterium]|nr:extracellular solute-binding protein [Chloroflexota bacterium]